MMRPIYAVLLSFVAGTGFAVAEVPSVSEAYATYLIEIVLNTKPDVSPEPVSDSCENCGGDGELGDGRTKLVCPACDGTGKTKKSSAVPVKFGVTAGWPPRDFMGAPLVGSPAPVVSKPEVWIYVTAPCHACDVWERLELPKLKTPRRIVQGGPYRNKPTFELRANGKKRVFVGSNTTAAQIDAAIKELAK